MSFKKPRKNRSGSGAPKAKPNAYGPAEDEAKSDGFFPMLAGMTLSLMLIFWAVSIFNSKTEETNRPPAVEKRDTVSVAINSTNFDQFLKDANPDQLVARLNELKLSTFPRLSPMRVSEQNQRIALCKTILDSDSNSQYKTFAKLEWLRSQKSTYGIDFIGKMKSPQVAEDFKQCFTRFLNDTDPNVYREAHLAQVSYYLFESIKGNQPIDTVSGHLKDILKKFPQDDHVLATLRLQFRACIESDITLAKQLAEEILRSDNSRSKRASEFAQFVLDSYQILKLNYGDMFVNRFVNGDAGLRELEKTSLMLLDNPESGNLVVDRVSEVVHWFERRHLFDRANRVFQGMIDASTQGRKIDSTTERLATIGNAGVARINSIGKKIDVSGETMAGKQINEDGFSGRIVLGLFFDPEDKSSINVLKQVERSARRYAEFGSPLRVFAVPTKPSDFVGELSGDIQSSRVNFFGWKDGRPHELLERFPVTSLPYLMALDHDGKLSRLNMDPKRYETDIEMLVDQR